jgi:hypothetical protein
MAGNKTGATTASVETYLASIGDAGRRKDCKALADIMARASKQEAKMWGASIVGFGIRKYPLSGGREGEICAVGFSSRKGDISIYGVTGQPASAGLLGKLGKHKMGKGCLYVARLGDIDLAVLEKLIASAARAKLG